MTTQRHHDNDDDNDDDDFDDDRRRRRRTVPRCTVPFCVIIIRTLVFIDTIVRNANTTGEGEGRLQ